MHKLSINPQDRILIVAPHPDDESIGCGGLLAMYGKQADVLVITDGRKAHDKSCTDNDCVEIRAKEISNAMRIVKVHKLIMLNVADGFAYKCRKVLRQIDFHRYNKVFIPNRKEEHADHRAVNRILRLLVRFRHPKIQIYEYEVWALMPYADMYLDISNVFGIKQEIVSQYKSQLAIRDYLAMIEGMSLYRGVLCHTRRAECYEHICFNGFLKQLYFCLPLSLQRLLRH